MLVNRTHDNGGCGDVRPGLDCSRADRRFYCQQSRNRAGAGSFLDIVLGVVGALVGGWLFQLAGYTGVTLFNLYSMFAAIVGAVVVLVIYHFIRGVIE